MYVIQILRILIPYKCELFIMMQLSSTSRKIIDRISYGFSKVESAFSTLQSLNIRRKKKTSILLVQVKNVVEVFKMVYQLIPPLFRKIIIVLMALTVLRFISKIYLLLAFDESRLSQGNGQQDQNIKQKEQFLKFKDGLERKENEQKQQSKSKSELEEYFIDFLEQKRPKKKKHQDVKDLLFFQIIKSYQALEDDTKSSD